MLRTAEPRDAAAMRDLLVETWLATYAPLVGAAAVRVTAERWLTPERLAQEIADSTRIVRLATDGDMLAGVLFATWQADGAPVAIDRLYVRPGLHRRGIGRRLLDVLAAECGPGIAFAVSVAAGNPAALAFYRALGFRENGRGRFDFTDTHLETIILRREPGPMLAIERASRDDLDAIVEILAADDVGGHGDTTDVALMPDYARTFADIEANPTTTLFVARENGRVVGTFLLVVYPALVGRGGNHAILSSVQVAPDRRGQGIGAAMVAAAEREAKARGAPSLHLTSNKTRLDAHRFYDRLGYERSHVAFRKKL